MTNNQPRCGECGASTDALVSPDHEESCSLHPSAMLRSAIGGAAAVASVPTDGTVAPLVRMVMSLSNRHLSRDMADHDAYERLNSYDGVVADRLPYGWQMWVPSEPEKHASDYDEVPAEVLRIQVYARAHHCDWVIFEDVGYIVPDLPVYEW